VTSPIGSNGTGSLTPPDPFSQTRGIGAPASPGSFDSMLGAAQAAGQPGVSGAVAGQPGVSAQAAGQPSIGPQTAPRSGIGSQATSAPIGAETMPAAPSAASSPPPIGGAGAAPVGGAGAAPAASAPAGAISSVGNSSLAGTDTFLKLLVAQMRNQDPSSPMDNQAFVTQLAQFNSVEQMLNIKQAITAELGAQQSAEGVALIGKTVAYVVPGVGTQKGTPGQGVVTGVSLAGGNVQLQVGGQSVGLSTVTEVSSS